MIRFRDVTKSYRLGIGRKTVLDNASFDILRGQSLGVLGVNGAGKSTLIRLISGASLPDRGRIDRRDVRVSWPLGFAGSFHGSLTGRENLRFACRIYGASIPKVTAFVQDFAELGEHLDMPVRSYSSGMKARLAFGLSMAIEFDVYLVDEITAVGDAIFKKRCDEVFTERRKVADVIMVSHSLNTLRSFCTAGCVLDGGRLTFYPTINAATAAYEDILKR